MPFAVVLMCSFVSSRLAPGPAHIDGSVRVHRQRRLSSYRKPICLRDAARLAFGYRELDQARAASRLGMAVLASR